MARDPEPAVPQLSKPCELSRAYGLGLTTIALPPPRRTGSAAASTRPPPRNSIPVAAPISARRAEHVAARLQRGRRRASSRNAGSACVVAVLRWLSRGSAIASRQRHAEVEPVDEDLQDGRDDRRAARRADREQRLAVVEHDRRAHRAARALAALDPVRVRQRVEVEVRQLVVQQEAAARDDDAGAAGRLDRERVRDDVAPAVGGGDVRRRPGARRGRGRLAAACRRRCTGTDRRARPGSSRPSRSISARRVAGEPVGEQPRQRDVEVRRVGEVRAAVGERVARGLDEAVQRRLAASSPRVGSPRGC